MTSSGLERAKSKHDEAKRKLWNLKSGKHDGAEQEYGRTYDVLARMGVGMRLKKKYR